MTAADQGWAAPPLAPPKPRTPRRRGQGQQDARRAADRGDGRSRGQGQGEDAQHRGPGRAASQPPAPGSLVTPERLAEFFAPRSIAVVGASPTSAWARFVLASAAATGFRGEVTPVHPRHKTVFGRPAVASLRDLAEPTDLAFIMAPAGAVEGVLDDAGAAGVRGAIVLASGYRETGEDGRMLEDRLVARAAAHGITLLGPNCLGFLNAHAKAGPFALTVPSPLQAGPVGIAIQSGALASVMLSFARSRAIGVSTLASLGNEAMVTAADVIDYLIEDDGTRVICLFLEQIGDPARFAAAAERADRAAKPIVALKAGSSAAGSQAALAHTGAIAGDDAVVDAALRQLNVIRVTSIEELLSTGALLGYGRRPEGRRMGVLTASGGACDIIADRAAAQGIEIPPFAPPTEAAITPHVPPFAQVRNPLDVTGYFLANRRTSALTAIDHALDAAVADPGLDFVYFSGLTLPDVRPADDTLARMLEERVAWIGQRMAASPIPVVPVGYTCVDVTEYGAGLLGRNGIHLLGGMELGVQAIGNALRWAEGRGRIWPGPASRPAGPAGRAEPGRSAEPRVPGESRGPAGSPAASGTWREADARELLAAFEVPLVPGELTATAEAAAAAARRLGYPVALRISSAEIAHKSDVGGVALGLRNSTQLRAGFKQVRAAGPVADGASIDGVMVSPMRTGGVELLAGISVDPAFGPVLAVGLGGVWVEVLGDVSLRVLPVGQDEVIRMLGELRGAPLLRGARGGRPAGLRALAGIIVRIAEAARSLGDSLRSVEVNPLWVDGDQIEALDVLVVTGRPGQTSQARQNSQADQNSQRRPEQPGRPELPEDTVEKTAPRPEQNGTGIMKLAHTREQQELRESVRRFLADRVPLQRVRELMDSADGTDEKIWNYAGSQLGLQAIAIPEDYGGAGFTFAEQAIVLEEQGAALYPGPYLASAVLAATALLASSDDAAKRDLLPGIASGETVATLAFTEDDGSWEPDAIRLAASEGDRGWAVDGHKSYVLDGNSASLILAVARTDAGLSLFALQADADGLARRELPTLDQTRRLARLEFSAVPARLIGAPGEGAAILGRTLDVAAIAQAAEQLGGAQRALDMAVSYAKIRHQFGRPIGSFQAIKHRCADLLLEVESLRSAVGYAAAAVAEDSAEVPVLAALVKALASDTYFHVAAENIQIHGGIGFTWEHDAHLYFKRAKASELFLGDASYHRERLATRIGV